MVTDEVFRALSDPTRRDLLDRLYQRDGRTLGELCEPVEMTRFGVMKHLRLLEASGLVTTHRAGREKLHYLNPVPIRLIHDRWIGKYTESRATALAELKTALEGGERMIVNTVARPHHVMQVYIHATPERIWEAITSAEFTSRYHFGAHVRSDLAVGSPFTYYTGDGETVLVEGELLEAEAPRRLVHTWHALYNPELAADVASRVTFEIEPDEPGVCKVTVTHEFVGETASYRHVEGGWSWILSNLKTLLETGEPLPGS